MAAYQALGLVDQDGNEDGKRPPRIFRDRTRRLDTMDDSELFARYRLPRHGILRLVKLVEPLLERSTQRSCPLSAELSVLITLRFLGKGSFQSELADMHGVAQSTVSVAIKETVDAFCNTLHHIKFTKDPTSKRLVKEKFYDIAGFPNVLGCIDGTLIPIKRPPATEEVAYVCRKGYHALNIQAICDADMR